MKLRASLSLLLASLVLACGGNEEAAATASTAPAAPVVEQSATPDAADTAGDALEAAADDAAEAAGDAIDAVTESAGDMADAVETDTAELMAAVTEAAPDGVPAPVRTDWQYSSGKHFSQLTSAQGTAELADGVEVAEVFWYGCPHCFNFDPYVEKWKQDLPDSVNLVRLPVMWNPTNEIHARMFYTAEALEKLDEMHPAFFRALHLDRKTLTREDDIRDFFGDYGVDADTFDKTFRSFAVESKLKRAKNLTARYRIRAVPVIVVNGKYLTDGPEIESFDDMLAVAAELVEREQQEL
jgi:thiol:disulfide interchange protein DsbA